MADDPDAGTRWINDRLFDEASGAITLTISENGLTTVEGRYPADNVIVEGNVFSMYFHLTIVFNIQVK